MKRKRIAFVIISVVGFLGLGALLLPSILHAMGLHPDHEAERYNLQGKTALIVTTSHAVLHEPGQTDGPATGVFASEMTIPYYAFLDSKMDVDVASIQGGEIPIDPQSFYYFLKSPQDKRFMQDEVFQEKVRNSIPVSEVDFGSYDVVFFAGGWGAAYDMACETVAEKVTDAYYGSDVVFGSVCHGALAFTEAKDSTGKQLVAGRKMTGVTQRQLKQLGIEHTPKHPQQELERAGADYRANHKWLDPLATLTVIDEERRFVTGQNQNSSHETAQSILSIINEQ